MLLHLNTRRSANSVASLLLLTCFVLTIVTAPQIRAANTITHYLADGFDYPVGKPNATGYYKARGFYPNGHLGEDWNGRGGGNTDQGDPVYSIAHGVVVYSADFRSGWGNVI
ncbi:MAG: M23 family metallopeptidase, partial [Verrucomicrobia bacterium]|nr:M23 family metallopeptidase [Verrucomicrobiota bacterium]